MTEQFVTLFDRNFLPQGIALHLSMQKHIKSYKLWILCLDDYTYDVLNKINLPSISLLKISLLETEALKKVKKNRTNREYCWTLTPFAPKFVFDADPTIERVTYLDADMFFRGDPSPIFNEFNNSGKSVLITDHAYANEHDQSKTSGQYCVQFIIFTKHHGEPVRQWWEDRCIEWCYMRFEDDKFGDQKYLEKWPILFPDKVFISKYLDYFLAPWNCTRFNFQSGICWHFHGLRIVKIFGKLKVYFGDYFLPLDVKQYVYKEYLSYLKLSCALLSKNGVLIPIQQQLSNKKIIKYFLKKIYFINKYIKSSNIFDLSEQYLKPIQEVTIITVCKNARQYIQETMESVLNQNALRKSRVKLQYIICDGCSTDGTLEIINKTASKYINKHNILIISEIDDGLYDGLAKSLRISSGEMLGYLNAGDYLNLNAFDILLDFFDQHPSISWVTGLNVIYNDFSQVVGASLPFRYRRNAIKKGLHGNFLPLIQQESTFWRSALTESIDLTYLKKLKYAGDAYIWKCFSSYTNIYILQAYLGGFRIHKGQISSNMNKYYEEQSEFSDRTYPWDYIIGLIDKICFHLPYSAKKFLNPKGILSFNHRTRKWE